MRKLVSLVCLLEASSLSLPGGGSILSHSPMMRSATVSSGITTSSVCSCDCAPFPFDRSEEERLGAVRYYPRFDGSFVTVTDLPMLVEEAQHGYDNGNATFDLLTQDDDAVPAEQQQSASGRTAMGVSLLLLVGGGIAYSQFGILPVLNLPEVLPTLNKFLPIAVGVLKRIVIIEVWQRFWQTLCHATRHALELSNVSVVAFAQVAPVWITEQLHSYVPRSIKTMFRRGMKKLAKKKVQGRIETLISSVMAAVLSEVRGAEYFSDALSRHSTA